MKSIAVTILIVSIVTVMGLYLVSFQVRVTESALVMTFGEPTREITKPGWYFKWPAPIQRVYSFDSRQRLFEADLEETPTAGGDPIIVNTYVVWKIAEPLEFFNANEHGTISEAESKLLSKIRDTQNTVIAEHNFSDFVNSDKEKIKFEEIEDKILSNLQQTVADANYGIEVTALGIKQLKISEEVSKEVFDRMKAERERKTLATIAEGNAQATAIRTDANSVRIELLAAAEARAEAWRGRGDAEAAKYYKMLDADPELAMFLRNIKTLKEILRDRATIVLTTDTDLIRLLQGKPDLRPAEPNEPGKLISGE